MPYGSIHIFVGGYSAEHAGISEYCGNDDTFHYNQPQDRPRCGPYGLADAEFAGAFFYGDEHDVAHADNAAEQCEQPHYPQCRAYDAYAGVHLYVVHVPVPQPYGAVVIGSGTVVGVQFGAVSVFKVLVLLLGDQPVKRKLDVADLVAHAVYGLYRGERSERFVVLHAFVGLVYAHHLICRAVDVDVAPHEAGISFRHQLLCMILVHHHHLSPFAYVDIVYEASVQQFAFVYLEVVGVYSCQVRIYILVSEAHCHTILAE